MNQRTFLGLTHNPFSPPREGFFDGADRRTHLDHLRHLSQWSRRVLVVTGPFGIGKSTLFKELSASLEANAKGARLSGSVVTTEREVLMGVLQGFGVGGEMDGHADDLSALICTHAEEQESHGRVCMVMVDDAHLLEAAALQRIVSLVADSPIRVVLFGEAGVVPNLNRAAKKCELEWFEIRLTGFPKMDVRDYLEWRFRQAQYRGLLPFTDEQLDKIVSRSGGNPSVIDSMANRLLADMESGEIRKQGTSFPVRHAVLAGVLVLMVGLIYLYVQTEPPDDAAADIALMSESDGEEAPVPLEDPLPVEPETFDVADPEPGEAEYENEDSTAAVPSEFEGEAPLEARDVPEPSPFLDEVADAQEMSDDSAVPEASITPEVQSPIPVVDSVAASPAAGESVEGAEAAEVAEAADVAEAPEASLVTDAPPAVTSSAAVYRDAAWILAQEGSRFTMQLLSLSSLERADAFINRQDDPGEFALYRTQRDGRSLFIVTYGLFSSREAAATAARGFSGELARIEPWIRPLRLVQDTVRANAQN